MVSLWHLNYEVPVVLIVLFVMRLIFIGHVYVLIQRKAIFVIIVQTKPYGQIPNLIFFSLFGCSLFSWLINWFCLYQIAPASFNHTPTLRIYVCKCLTQDNHNENADSKKHSEMFKVSHALKYKVEVLHSWPSTK